MPKEFITEKDIEDMVKRGIHSLEVNDNVVLTDLAYEKASRLGVTLVRDKPDNPPSAPVRPYLSQKQGQPAIMAAPSREAIKPATPISTGGGVQAPQADGVELHQRIYNAVIARLGNQVDPHLVDAIITRVLQSTGVK